MADIPPPSSLSSSSPGPPAVTPSSGVAVIEAAVNNVPDKIQNLARQIELSGTITQLPTGNGVVLNTVAGTLTFLLPHLVEAQKDKLLQQLVALFESQRPMTIVMQPGNPPAQAFLLLPPVSTPTQNPAGTSRSAKTTAASTAVPLPLLPNTVLSAVVLPKTVLPDFPLATQTAPSPLEPSLYPGAGPALNPANPAFAQKPGLSSLQEPVNAPPGPAGSRIAVSNPVPGPLPPAVPFSEIALLETAIVQEALAKLEGQALPNIIPPKSPIGPQYMESFQTVTTGKHGVQPPSATPQSLFRPGAELSLRVDAIIAPAVRNPVSLAAGQIVATVAGNGPGGQLILKTDDSTLYVRQPADLPPGTQLVVTATPARPDAPALLTVSDPQQLTALQQMLAALTQADPAVARQIVEAHIPQPGAALPGALLFFLSAVRQGDVRGWLGANAVDLLNRTGKFELIAKLAEEFQQAGRTVRDGVVGEWRSYPVPIFDHGHLQILNLYVHGDRQHAPPKEDSAARPGAAQVRFLIDMRMSRLGPMQLDGFLQRRQLDVIIRSEHPLPPGLNEELRQAYIRALGAVDYAGTINFQSGRQHWLNLPNPGTAQKAVVT